MERKIVAKCFVNSFVNVCYNSKCCTKTGSSGHFVPNCSESADYLASIILHTQTIMVNKGDPASQVWKERQQPCTVAQLAKIEWDKSSKGEAHSVSRHNIHSPLGQSTLSLQAPSMVRYEHPKKNQSLNTRDLEGFRHKTLTSFRIHLSLISGKHLGQDGLYLRKSQNVELPTFST